MHGWICILSMYVHVSIYGWTGLMASCKYACMPFCMNIFILIGTLSMLHYQTENAFIYKYQIKVVKYYMTSQKLLHLFNHSLYCCT